MRYRDVGVFLGIAFGLTWLLWVVEQVTGVQILFFAAMMSVAVATFVAARWVWRPSDLPRATSLVPVRPLPRTLRWCALAAGLFLVMGALALALNHVTGVYPADLGHLDWTRGLGPALVQFVLILPLAFCEEWGWRGYLLNRLREGLGTWPALIVIGVIGGLWHLPFYVRPWFAMSPDARASFVPFVIFVVLFGVVLGLLRLASGSIWPAVVAHAVNNTIVFGYLDVLVSPGVEINPWVAALSGWQGWLILIAAAAVLTMAGPLRIHRRMAINKG
ncbi:type II CAAX endopeptidase family protein [Actinoplanes sp. NPDC089786]|uniref:CPBP family intramembrane glutamic endopeptidase n=1 Tax=Actinoplanes sp. NPDC089786 TaxID=3155185 RepID=UPI00342642CB